MIVKVKENWFWPLAITLAALAWAIGHFSKIEPNSSWEHAVIFDVLLTLPILYSMHRDLACDKDRSYREPVTTAVSFMAAFCWACRAFCIRGLDRACTH
jgi:hypothetical protein